MALSGYELLEASSPAELASLVNAKITGGKQPLGSALAFPESNNRLFFQAVAAGTPDGGGGLPAGSVAVKNDDTILVLSAGTAIVAGSAVVDTEAGTANVEIGAGQHLVVVGNIGNVKNSAGTQTTAGTIGYDTDLFVQLDTVHTVVANNATVAVTASGADSHNGTATVAAGVLTRVDLPATNAIADDGDTVTVHNSAFSAQVDALTIVGAGQLTGVLLPDTSALVNNTNSVDVQNSAGADTHTGTAAVAAGVITGVKLASTVAMVDNADAVAVHNSAGANVTGSHTAEVAAGVLTDVKLAATVAPVLNGQALTGVAPTGTYTNTVTFTVANGVITAIALS